MEEKPETLLASAKSYLAKKDPKAALIQLKTALQKQPTLAEGRFLLGRTLLETGDAIGAEVELRKALEAGYPEASVLPELARALVQQGKSQRAIKDYAEVEIAEPTGAAALKTVLANAYAQIGNQPKAQEMVAGALSTAPGYIPALVMEARTKTFAREFDAAFALLDEVIAKDPGNYEALQLRGDLLFFVKGDAAGAIATQRLALAQRKDWMPSYASILEILLGDISRRDLKAAKAQIDDLKKVLPNHPQTKYFEARLAYLQQDYATARELIQKVLNFAPDNINVLLLAGGIELQGGSLTQAENLVTKALQLAPDVAMTRQFLAQIYLRSGQASRALETLAPLLAKPDANAEVLALAGQSSLQTGDLSNAEAYLSRAAKLNPNDTRSRTALALTQFSKNNAALGFAQLEEIAATDKGTVADMAIVSTRMREKDYNGALKAVDSIDRKDPGKAFTAQVRGEIHIARNDLPAAREAFNKALSIDPLYFPAAASLAKLDLLDKKPEQARKHFEALLAKDPKNVRALMSLTELRAQAGASKDEIAGMLTNAIKLNPTAMGPRLLLIELHLRNKDSKTALSAANDAVAAMPENPELLDALGRAQMATGDIDQAVNTFNKLVGLQRRSPEPHMRLALAHMALKNPDAARESLNRALEASPKLIAAQRALIMLELNAGRPDQAMAVARTVQSERPGEGVGYLFAGDIEASRKNWDAAANAYRAGLKRGEISELAAKLHGVLTSAKKQAEAEAFAASWVKGHPKDAAFRTYLGDMALANLDFTGAESHYRAVLDMYPNDAAVLNNLAWIMQKLKKPGAAEYAEKANALRPEQPAFMDTLASILAEAGQVDKAVALEKRAVALAPEHPNFRLSLAKFYIKSGDKLQAKVELDELAKLGDKFPNQAEVGELRKTL